MELAKDGTQPYVQGCMKPEGMYKKLTTGKPKHQEAVSKVVEMLNVMIKFQSHDKARAWGILCAEFHEVQC